LTFHSHPPFPENCPVIRSEPAFFFFRRVRFGTVSTSPSSASESLPIFTRSVATRSAVKLFEMPSPKVLLLFTPCCQMASPPVVELTVTNYSWRDFFRTLFSKSGACAFRRQADRKGPLNQMAPSPLYTSNRRSMPAFPLAFLPPAVWRFVAPAFGAQCLCSTVPPSSSVPPGP